MKKRIAKLFKIIKDNWIFALFVSFITIVSIAFTIKYSSRILTSLKSLGRNIVYFISYDFLKDKTPPMQTIDDLLLQSGGTLDFVLPMKWDLFIERLELSFYLLINKDIWSFYLFIIYHELLLT